MLEPRRDPTMNALRALLRGEAVPATSALARAAHRHEVAVLACSAAPALATTLGEVVTRQRRYDALLELALADLAPALAAEPVALLKGSAAAAWVYPETAQRMRRDIDLLVADLDRVGAIMTTRGWHPREVTPRAVTLTRAIGNVTIAVDLHAALTHDQRCDVDAMLAARVVGKAALPVTTPADTFVHTCVHLVGTGFHEPLKGWVDLLRLHPVAPDLQARATLHGQRRAVWACLGVLERWFGLTTERGPTPPDGALIDWLLAGEHDTPERRALPRGVSYRLWRRLLR